MKTYGRVEVQLHHSWPRHWIEVSGGNRPRYPLCWKLDAPQSRSGRFGEEKILHPATNRTPVVQPVTIPTELSGLPCSRANLWLLTSGIRRRVVWQFFNNISEDLVAVIFVCPEDGHRMSPWNLRWPSPNYMALYPIKQNTSYRYLWEPRILHIAKNLYYGSRGRGNASRPIMDCS
jgi:hypothetical protein